MITSLRTMEFEFPAIATLLLIMLCYFYFSKKRIVLIENRTYEVMLIASLVSSILDTVIHIICATHTFEQVQMNFYGVLDILNKFVSTGLVLVFSMLCLYTILISKEKIRNNSKKVVMIFLGLNILFFIATWFCHIELLDARLGTNATGSLMNLAFLGVAIFLILTLIVTIVNFKKDKRYYAIFIILGILLIFYICAYFFKALIIYDIAMAIFCYVMYFSIENPDLQMLREFHKQRELANESNQEKTSFLFNMSNQIKEPILAISNISGEALLEDNMEEVKEDLRRIKSSSSELLQLVNDVLDISDIEKRKIGIRGNKYNIYNLFEVLNKNFSKNVNKKIEYRFHFDKSIPEYLYGDSIRIKQVMNILLENALEYTNEGFIEVNVNSIMKHDICRLIITVEDSGIGMSTEEIKHLFDKEKIYSDEELKKVDDTKNNLGVLKSIVNLMNGNVLVNSELGKGSKFTIIIDQKVKEEKTKIIETVEQYEEMYENKEKILLVINHKEISKKINKMFKKDTYEIEEVSGGQACLEKIRKNEKFDLIIMEEDLDKLSSEDTLIKLKDTSGYKIPVILISNNKGFGAKEMYQEKGFKDVLFLPLKKEEVLKQVEEYIKD